MFLSWEELQAIKREIRRISERIQLLDMSNPFERREIHTLTAQLRTINSTLNQRKPIALRRVK